MLNSQKRDARLPGPPCAFCRNHRTITLPDKNVPCPACSAPEQAADDMLVFDCPECGQRESLTPGKPCGGCRGRQLAKDLVRPPAPIWTLAAIVADRSAQ